MSILFLFLLGSAIGSFLNVLIDRIPRDESVVKGRSHCDKCKHILAPYDLIPLLSYILLAGRCRYCKTKLSFQYPLVEFITGMIFVFIYIYIINTSNSNFLILNSYFLILNSIYILIIMSSLLVIFITDLKYRIIPDQILIFDLPLIFIYLIINNYSLIINHFLSGFALFLLFLLLVLITRGKGMGFGDVKFAFVMGFLLGFPKIIVAFYLSFLTGAFFSIILILVRHKRMKDAIPFGPFLAASTAISMLYGDKLWFFIRQFSGI
jgi:prepilin signal peptidase PulO-like enzyme (type II secretory pathway)